MLREGAEREDRAARGRPAKTSSAATLNAIGVSRDQSSKWQQVAALSDDEFEDALETTQAITHETMLRSRKSGLEGPLSIRLACAQT